jgi:N-dimethylarginine dimethylaminohydrolase
MAITQAAYQGKGWRPRRAALAAELAASGAPRVNSEYKRLRAVLLYCPGPEMRRVRDPNAVQHIAKIDPAAAKREYSALAAAFRRSGVAVQMMRPLFERGAEKFNLMYVRDLFVNTPEGAVAARMASEVRAGEELYAVAALAGLGVPVVKSVSGSGLFEGADALWLDGRTMLCGVGNRTNGEGLRQLRAVMSAQGVKVHAVRMPGGVQHLLGLLQIVDRRLALLRSEKAPPALAALLKKKGFKIVPVPEGPEVSPGQGMNVVAVAPRRVIMPAGRPGLEKLYRAAGISVAAEVEISQLINGAGGIACATGILSRDI